MAGRMNFGFTFGSGESPSKPRREEDDPLRILVVGSFSGSAESAKPRVPLQKRPVVKIDIDNFDEVLKKFAPRVQIGGEALEIQELDDFRPEQLGKKVPTLRRLLELRQGLLNPKTFDQTATQWREQFNTEPVAPESSPPSPSPATPSAENDATTLERILGKQTSSPGAASLGLPFDIQKAIGQIVQPHVIPAADPSQKVYVASATNAVADRLRAVLHDPSFQALEATWRSLRALVASIEDDSQIKIQLLDVTAEELRQDVPTNDESLEQWPLHRRVTSEADQSPGIPPWSLIIADTTITASSQDLTLLGALTGIAQQLQTPLIAAGESNIVGCPSLHESLHPADWKPLDADADQYWQALRKSPAAAWVGLAGPRVLLRLPYGKETDEIESFEFEEFASERRHEDYLWGNPAYRCAELIIQAFAAEGWSLELPSQLDIDDLPAHTYRDDGETKLQPCAEVAFSERVAEAFLQRGLMPLMSWKDRNAVRFLRFQSIANPATALAGFWS